MPDDIKPDPADYGGEEPSNELSHCGAVVDKAIEYMVGQSLPPMAIASALLGGSLGVLARTMGDDRILQVLESAVNSVRSGELRREYGPPRH